MSPRRLAGRAWSVALAGSLMLTAACTTRGGSETSDSAPSSTPPSLETQSTTSSAAPGLAPAALERIGARAAHTATPLRDGSLLIAGGCVTDGCSVATDETIVITPDLTVLDGPTMAVARDAHTATAIEDGRVVIAGGYSAEGTPPLRSREVYDPTSHTISPAADLATARGGHAAVLLTDGRILFTGGWSGPRTYTASTEFYDPAHDTVTSGPDLPLPLAGLDAVTLGDGRVLVTGGRVQNGEISDGAWILDAAGEEWANTGPLLTPRAKHLSVLLADGSVLVIGGEATDGSLLATTERYDPATGAFGEGPVLLEARYKLTGGAVVLEDNTVLIGGGGRSVELLDLASGTSKIVAEFADRGSFATVSLLASGDPIVVGGYGDGIALRREARIIPRAVLSG